MHPEKIMIIRDYIADQHSPIDYMESWEAMRSFTRSRDIDTPDEIWLLEHPPIYTLGQAADEAHILGAVDVPVLKVDRGGQVTYHGPGQLMIYTLCDLQRCKVSVRELVLMLETTIIEVLKEYGISAAGDRKAPGVYVEGKKIAALGLRVSRGCCYHGICFNFDFDKRPFQAINPCGYEGLEITQLSECVSALPDKFLFARRLAEVLCQFLNCNTSNYSQDSWPK